MKKKEKKTEKYKNCKKRDQKLKISLCGISTSKTNMEYPHKKCDITLSLRFKKKLHKIV